jgi:hypothetical protein
MSLHGSTWILTENGPRNIKDLCAQKIKIFSNGNLIETDEKGVIMSSPSEAVYRVKTKQGFELMATKKTQLWNGREWIAIENLKSGHRVYLHDHLPKREHLYWNGDNKPLGDEDDINILEMKSSDFCKTWLKSYLGRNVIWNDHRCIVIENDTKDKMQLIQRMLFRFGIVSVPTDLSTTTLVVRGAFVSRLYDLYLFPCDNAFEVEVTDIQIVSFDPVYYCYLPSGQPLDANGFIVKF